MKTYNITDTVEFNVYPGELGVCVSGGADSALMLYFLLKYAEQPLHVFSVASQEKLLRNTHAAVNVISKCTELTQNYNLTHHIAYVTAQTKQNLFLVPMQFLENKQVSTVYTGVTKNPPFAVTDTFVLETLENHERDPTVIRLPKQGDWYMPWTNLNKQDLCVIYQQYGLMDTLFTVTRSCEWINHDWDDPGDGHCGKCWWCEERLWGFGRL